MIVDLSLVRRVEHSMGRHVALQTDALALTAPTSAAHWAELDGGVMVSMGAGRYVNRAIGVAVGDMDPRALLDSVEAFYRAERLPASLEVSTWATAPLIEELRRRGYGVEWFRNVFARTLDDLPTRDKVPIREVDSSSERDWAAILGEQAPVGTLPRARSDEFCAAMRRVVGSVDLVATPDGRAIACGSVTTVADIGWLGGAATLEAQRGRGLQMALLVDRLHRARSAGCTLVAVTALPSITSSRNIARAGFQLLYSQAVMTRG